MTRHLSIFRARRSRTWNSIRRLAFARDDMREGLEDYRGEIEDGWTNYGMNRCYQEEGRLSTLILYISH